MSRQYKLIFSLFAVLIIIFSSFYIGNFRIDASSDTLVSQNDKDFKFFKYYQEIFPTKNNLVVAIKSSKIIDKNLLNEIEVLSNKIEKLPEVSSVFNINKAPILFLNNTSLQDLSNNDYETIINTDYSINDVLEEFKNSPIYSSQIINEKKNITSIIIFLKPDQKVNDLKKNKTEYIADNTYYKKKSEIDKNRNELITKIRTILNKSNKDYIYYLGGVEMISNDVISFVKKDIILFSALVLSLVILILFIIFKQLKWVLTILLSSLFSVYTMIGFSGFINFEVTAVSANFLSLMFILSVSMNIHVLNNYLGSNNSLFLTMKEMFWPCFYTFLTTVVAFLSLLISDIKPIIDFGIIMIISLIVVLITAFTVLPLLISFFSKNQTKENYKYALLEIFIDYSSKFKKQILIVNFLFFLISIFGIFNLNVENSFIKYFKKNTEIYQGMRLIDKELGGTTPLDIILQINNDFITSDNNSEIELEDDIEFEEDIFSDELFNNENVWFTDEKITIIEKIHKYLENRPEIGKVISIYSLIDVANQINKNKLSSFELSVLYNEIPNEYKEDLIAPYLNTDENMIKIFSRVKDSEEINRSNLIKEIKDHIEDSYKNINEFKINGLLVLYNNMLSSLFTSQIKSLGFVLLSIFLMFIILFKSIKLSVAGIIPNILASTFILGLIGLFKIPLDIMTITIAAISIGIAVDNTIHYLYRYKINKTNDLNLINSIKLSHLNVGKAVLITSITISGGFLILCFSNFVPTMIFGLFTSLAMIFAMIGVLITLPSILHYIK